MDFVKESKIKCMQFGDGGLHKPYAENGNLYIPLLVFGGGINNTPIHTKMVVDLEIPHDVLMEAIQGATCISAFCNEQFERSEK